MTKSEINAKLKELLNNEFSANTVTEANNLLAEYQQLVAAEHKLQLDKLQAEDPEIEAKSFSPKRDEYDENFDELWAKYGHIKKEVEDKRKQEQKVNLGLKQNIIQQVRELEQEEHIKNAFEKINNLIEDWKKIGQVPAQNVKDLQSQFTKAKDNFYYNIRIYKELLENDLKKNLQLKQEVLERMNTLKDKSASPKEIESEFKTLLNDWDEIGPTYKEQWETIKADFRASQKVVYEKIKSYYLSVKEQMQRNLESKESLCDKVEKINNEEIVSEKRWRKLTEQVKGLQEEWKTIGFANKKENEAVWERFKTAGDLFFSNKSQFYLELKKEQDHNKALKKSLVDKSSDLKNSADWKTTSKELVRLQKEWQKIGPAHQRDEQKLWKQFRANCNEFFESKKKASSGKSEKEVENLKLKKEIIGQVEAFSITDNKEKDIEELTALSTEFSKIGFVPIKDKNSINDHFKTAIHAKLKEHGLSSEAIQDIEFHNKISELKGAPNSVNALYKEDYHIQEKIKKAKATLIQYENNLGFIGKSKAADALKKQVETKINIAEKQIQMWESRRRILLKTIDELE